MVYRLVFFRMTRFRYFTVGEYHPQFTCNSDANLVNREVKFVFLQIAIVSSLLGFVMVKKQQENLTFCRRNQQIN